MKTKNPPSLSLALLVLLAGSALAAGPIAGAVNTTSGVVAPVGVVTTPAASAPRTSVAGTVSGVVSAPGLSGSVSTNAGGAVSGKATGTNASGSLDMSAAAAGTDFDTIGMRQERLQARADANASKDVKAIGQLESTLRSTAYADRESVDSDISTSLAASQAAMTDDEARITAASKAKYDASRAEVSAREAALTESLKAAHSASKDAWEAARDDVATNYSLYASAVLRSRALAAEGSVAASGALDSGNTVALIRSANDSAKAQIAADIRAKLAASEKAMSATETAAKKLGGEARENYATAARVAAHRERDVKRALYLAEKTAAADWNRARMEVASTYADFAEAVSRAELAAAARVSAGIVAKSSPLQTASTGTFAATERN